MDQASNFLSGVGSFLSAAWPYVLISALIFIALKIWTSLRVVVPTNEAHIVQSRTKTTSFGKGKKANTYMRWPSWVPFFGVTRIVLPVNNFSIDLNNYEAYDVKRTPFSLNITAFFRINDTDMAAERVSDFEGLKRELIKILQGAVRHVLSSKDINEIMVERSTFGEKFTAEVQNELKSWGVETVKAIELMDIHDANGVSVIKDIMAINISEIDAQSRKAVAENNRVAETAEIEAERQIELARQEKIRIVGQRTAEQEREVGIAREKSSQDVQAEAAITKQRVMEVISIETQRTAEIAREAAIVKADEQQRTSVIRAEGEQKVKVIQAEADRQADITKAEGEKQQTILIAEGKKEQMLKNADGVRAEGEAKARAEEAMQLASVTAQTTLAEKVGDNKAYQDFIVRQREVEKDEKIGVAQAQALAAGLDKADIKVIANAGSATDGINSLPGLLSSAGGMKLGAMLDGLRNTETGKEILAATLDKVSEATSTTKTVRPNGARN